jgi:hypothetical protein
VVSEPVIYLEVPLAQEWGSVEPLRQLVRDRLASTYGDVDAAHRIAMVAAELLENAVKFGRWAGGGPGWLATLRVVSAERTATVTVTNPVDPDRPGVRRLLELLQGLQGSSPAEAYQARLAALAEEAPAGEVGLGLARVAYEAGCRLSASVSSEGLLRVVAVMTR